MASHCTLACPARLLACLLLPPSDLLCEVLLQGLAATRGLQEWGLCSSNHSVAS